MTTLAEQLRKAIGEEVRVRASGNWQIDESEKGILTRKESGEGAGYYVGGKYVPKKIIQSLAKDRPYLRGLSERDVLDMEIDPEYFQLNFARKSTE